MINSILGVGKLANFEGEILYLRYKLLHSYVSILGGEPENFGGEISPPNNSEMDTEYYVYYS